MADPSRPATGYPNPPINGYPYSAPPPPQYYNPNVYYARPYLSRPSFFRYFLIFIVSSFIICGAVIFIIWLVLRPHYPDFRVDSATLSNLSTSPSSITGNWDIRFHVRNPNRKLSLRYDRIVSSLYYRRQMLAETAIEPFSQGTKSETNATASFAARGAFVEASVVRDLNGERERGSIGFDLTVIAESRFSAGWWRARRRLVRVLCEDVRIGLAASNSSGNLLGGGKECRVG